MTNLTILYAYKRRHDAASQPVDLRLSDCKATILADIEPDPALQAAYTRASTVECEVQNIPSVSDAGTNTVRKQSVSHGQLHLEGCWPKDVNINDIEHRLRYRKKAEKDDECLPAVKSLIAKASPILRQNNAVDIYHLYFSNVKRAMQADEPRRLSVPGGGSSSSASGNVGSIGGVGGKETMQFVSVLSDPLLGASYQGSGAVGLSKNTVANSSSTAMQPRTVCGLAWQPVEGQLGRKLAVAYCNLRNPFVSATSLPRGDCLASYVWDPTHLNTPDIALHPPSQLTCLDFNEKDLHLLGGGCQSGIVCCFDCRIGGRPVISSPLFSEAKAAWGHRGDRKGNEDEGTGSEESSGAVCAAGEGGVKAMRWLQTNGRGQEIATINGSNICRVWDTRSLKEPIDVIRLSTDRYSDAVSLDYQPATMPNKLLVGTTLGNVLTVNRRGKSSDDRVASIHKKHHGPVYSLSYNPHVPKVFLSAGDWTARIWHEDHVAPLTVSHYSTSPLVDAAWHPHHPGLYVVALVNGRVEVRSPSQQFSESVLSCQVSNDPLHCIKLHPEGEKLAVGTSTGKTYIMQMPSLSLSGPLDLEGMFGFRDTK
eukprot:gene2915-4576_t